VVGGRTIWKLFSGLRTRFDERTSGGA